MNAISRLARDVVSQLDGSRVVVRLRPQLLHLHIRLGDIDADAALAGLKQTE